MNRTILTLGILLILPAFLIGCFEEQRITLEDHPPQVEWAPPNPNSADLEYTATVDSAQVADGESKDITLEVGLIGTQEPNDRTINFAVDEDESDAEEGVHFEILNDGNTATIPGNESFGDVNIRVHGDDLEPGQSVLAVLVLQESEDLGVAVNMSEMELTIEREEEENEE